MIPTPYAFTLALQSMIREKWINILSVLSIGSGLLIISLALFSVYNIDAATRSLPEKFSMVLYLDKDINKENVDSLVSALKKQGAVHSVRYIPKEEAMRELKAVLKNSSYVLDGLEENPLPDALEVKLTRDVVGPEAVKRLADEALKIKGVKEVEYAEKFLSALHYLKVGLKTIGIILIATLSTGIVFVCYSTVKILFYRRKEEIETFKLLGATRGFIRTPFLIEGAVIGTTGGILSLVGIFVFYYLVLLRLSVAMPIFKMILFPSTLFLPLPFLGMFLGMTGAAIALGRLRY
ncbi:putative Cell division protein FtsX [Candidatus Sulfobium mesophilum]|uniref:Cell division protein FtsX n=1 Tax=Candidatus Sulfobium mesophilum TaxID=2016548 RepID=A0A2U3QGG5_9BACT|nr:putative Cell division protein FtsX [Candidatus Sulfobium mesophilum]